MDLNLPTDLDPRFTSRSQIPRLATETWTATNFYCAACGTNLTAYPPGTKVYDFYSLACNERFQLKASDHQFGRAILGAEYKTTLQSIMTDAHPSLILMHYDSPERMVQDLMVIHRGSITSSCIVARNPLRPTARRAGWQGCLLLLNRIPKLGKIGVINDGVVKEKSEVLAQWKRSDALLKVRSEFRGWLADVVRCTKRLMNVFTLADVYQFEEELSRLHPKNMNVRPKIRQQLQRMRDLGLIEFVEPGAYGRLS